LEYVRINVAGGITLKDFHAQLRWVPQSDGTPFDISYGSAVYYHRDREPPLSYMEQVSRIFDVRIEWLLTEEGPVRKQDPSSEEKAAAIRTKIHSTFRKWLGRLAPVGFVGIESLTIAAMSNVAYLLQERQADDVEAVRVGAASSLAHAIAAPLSALGVLPDTWPEAVKAQYVAQMCAALLVPLELESDRLFQQKQKQGSTEP